MNASLHPTALVDPKAVLHDHVSVGPYCIVGPEVTLHSHVVLHGHNVIQGHTSIGAHTELHPFSCIGGLPQDKKYQGEPSFLTIGEQNIFREYCTVHTGTQAGGCYTRVGHRGLFMVGVHIAHDCIVGDDVIMSNHATLAGHVQVGDHAIIGGLSAVHQFARIGTHAFIGGMSGVTWDVVPFGMALGNRAVLSGLNVVGLKRRGFPREEIQLLREAYHIVFDGDKTSQPFALRLEALRSMSSRSSAIHVLLAFLEQDTSRAICQPKDALHMDDYVSS